MSYSEIYLRTRNKPSFLLIVMAIIAVAGFFATYFQPNVTTTKASKESLLVHSIVNLSARQAGIYYQTTTKTPSWVVYGTSSNSLNRAAFDERDTEDNRASTFLHYVPLNDLQENTTYYYKIIADGEVISVNNSSTFSF